MFTRRYVQRNKQTHEKKNLQIRHGYYHTPHKIICQALFKQSFLQRTLMKYGKKAVDIGQ